MTYINSENVTLPAQPAIIQLQTAIEMFSNLGMLYRDGAASMYSSLDA